MAERDTPTATDDLVTAERKSKSVDERVRTRSDPDVVPELELPGSAGAYVPQAGIGATGPLGSDAPGPGERVLEHEAKAQKAPIQRG
jgi:hypothetical protein